MKFNKFIFFVFLLSGCAKTETVRLEAQSEEWLTGYDYDETFDMIDENNISLVGALMQKIIILMRVPQASFLLLLIEPIDK